MFYNVLELKDLVDYKENVFDKNPILLGSEIYQHYSENEINDSQILFDIPFISSIILSSYENLKVRDYLFENNSEGNLLPVV